ncbi:MAG TPA: hypothetical protein VKW09_13720 [bacterium]|nr:hypothetical protein [bacterium]
MRRAKPARLVLCVFAMAGAAAVGVGSQAVAAGDPAAKAEAIAAFQKLNTVPSYRIKWTSPEGVGVAEIVQPDKRHFTGKGDKGSVEIFQIGADRAIRYDVPGMPSGWRCGKSQTISTYFDIDKMRSDTTVEAVRKPDTVIDGMPVHVYANANSGEELYVGAQTGLPRRYYSSDKRVTADFYDYGAPITITPPPCG